MQIPELSPVEIHALYADLAQTLTRVGCFHRRDEDILNRSLQEIFNTDWLNVSPALDKKKILQALVSCGLSPAASVPDSVIERFSERWSNQTLSARLSPAWETILRREWKDEAFPVMSIRDRLWYGSSFQSMQIKLVNVLTESVHYRKLYAIRRPQRARILPAVQGYLMSIVWYYLMHHFYHREDGASFKTLEALRSFIELAKEGCGMVYAAGNGARQRVVLRLPVWDEKEYPVNISEDEGSSRIDVCVLMQGVYVPEKVWRFPERLSVSDIAREPNAEVRRIMINTMGNEKFLHQSNAIVIDERDGLKLYSVSLTERMRFNLVQCVCPTTLRVYYLRVPPEITDANTAIAWTFGETGQSYQPERET